MKILLFVFGLWFAYWNYCGFDENPQAVWHFVALMFTVVALGLCAFGWFFDWATSPVHRARYLESGAANDEES